MHSGSKRNGHVKQNQDEEKKSPSKPSEEVISPLTAEVVPPGMVVSAKQKVITFISAQCNSQNVGKECKCRL